MLTKQDFLARARSNFIKEYNIKLKEIRTQVEHSYAKNILRTPETTPMCNDIMKEKAISTSIREINAQEFK